MSWVVVGVGAGTALLGAYTASEQRRAAATAQEDQNRRSQNITAAQTQYSPWTHLSPQTAQTGAVPAGVSDLGGALQGAEAGYLTGQSAKQRSLDQAKTQAQIDALKAQELKAQMDALKGGGGTSWSDVTPGAGKFSNIG